LKLKGNGQEKNYHLNVERLIAKLKRVSTKPEYETEKQKGKRLLRIEETLNKLNDAKDLERKMKARRHEKHMEEEQKVKAERLKNLHVNRNGYISPSKKRRGSKTKWHKSIQEENHHSCNTTLVVVFVLQAGFTVVMRH